MAVLTNVCGLEIQFRFSWEGVVRYVNEAYFPIVESDDFDAAVVADDFAAQLTANVALMDGFSVDCTLLNFMIRVRGLHPQVGQTFTRTLDIPGEVVGNPSPSWLVWRVYQTPDNTGRYVINPPQTPFRQGSLALPGVSAASINGNTVDAGTQADLQFFATAISGISEGTDAVANPGFEWVMVRRSTSPGGAPQQYANILGVEPGRLGHQDTARQ